MDRADIAHQRLHRQLLSRRTLETPADVVRWMGALQAQDYVAALWAVGLRTRDGVLADVERAIAEREIVRTWPMRGTLHFVAADDVRWMLELLTPRVIEASAGRMRQLAIDEQTLSRSRDVLVRALQDQGRLTRAAMLESLERGGVSPSGQRGYHILARLAQEGQICFGPREGKQQTFVLLGEWVPAGRDLDRDEALAELARRYFTSHGPATLRDFMWWSGLRASEARKGVEMARPHLTRQAVDGQDYWLSRAAPDSREPSPIAHLLPAYDEYVVAYRDRGAVLDPAFYAKTLGGVISPVVVVDGRVVGTWSRSTGRSQVRVATCLHASLGVAELAALLPAAERYGRFLGLSAIVTTRPLHTAGPRRSDEGSAEPRDETEGTDQEDNP